MGIGFSFVSSLLLLLIREGLDQQKIVVCPLLELEYLECNMHLRNISFEI